METEIPHTRHKLGEGPEPKGYYEVKLPHTSAPFLRVKTLPDVFVPTETSLLLIEACSKLIKKPGKTLDLGCGCGITGLVLSRLGFCSEPVYASDISAEAVHLTLENAKTQRIECIVRVGSLFEPWRGVTMDYIVDDISGISDEIAEISPWFPTGVSCRAGKDGTRWITQVLEQASGYLNPEGVLIFPVLSLSNEEKILKTAHANFSSVEMLLERQWSLPRPVAQHTELVSRLMAEGAINCVRKFGTYIWWTRVFAARRRGV